jgi:hypothetical protein
MGTNYSFTENNENIVKMIYSKAALKNPVKASYVNKLLVGIQKHQKVSRKTSKILFFLMTMITCSSVSYADVNPDEEVLFYDMTVDKGF